MSSDLIYQKQAILERHLVLKSKQRSLNLECKLMRRRYYPEAVSFVFWKNPQLHGLFSRFTDLSHCLLNKLAKKGVFIYFNSFDQMVGEIKQKQRTGEEASKFITILKIGALGIYQGSNMQFGNSPRYSKALRYTTIICTKLEIARVEQASHICRCARNLMNLIHKTLSKKMKKLVKLQHVFHFNSWQWFEIHGNDQNCEFW